MIFTFKPEHEANFAAEEFGIASSSRALVPAEACPLTSAEAHHFRHHKMETRGGKVYDYDGGHSGRPGKCARRAL